MQDIITALRNLTNPPPTKKTFGLTLVQTLPGVVTLTAVDPATGQPLAEGNLLSIITTAGQSPKLVLHDEVNSELGFDVDDGLGYIIPFDDRGEPLVVF